MDGFGQESQGIIFDGHLADIAEDLLEALDGAFAGAQQVEVPCRPMRLAAPELEKHRPLENEDKKRRGGRRDVAERRRQAILAVTVEAASLRAYLPSGAPFGKGCQEVRVSQRLVMNYFTAKRLLGALQMTVQRHEGAFGSLELDVRRRTQHPGGR